MKPRKHFLFILFIVLSQYSTAQKNASVIGDVSRLIDLLKKDYNSIDPETRENEILKDRTLTIAIFKTYLTEDQKNSFSTALKMSNSVAGLQIKYKDARQKLDLFKTSSISITNTVVALDIYNTEKKLIDELSEARKNYLSAKDTCDNIELNNLITSFEKENKFVSNVITQFKTKYENINSQLLDKNSAVNNTAALQKALPFIGGDLGYEIIFDGLSRFLAKRIKEELSTYVLERIKAWLNNPNQEEWISAIKIILPRTTAYMSSFRADNLLNFPNEIKQYIEDDINNSLSNLANLKMLPTFNLIVQNYPEMVIAFSIVKC